MRHRLLAGLAVAALLGLVGCSPAPAAAPEAPPGPAAVTVMTRNLYLGGDIDRPLQAAQGKSGTDVLAALAAADDTLRRIVDATDFPARSEPLAQEIAGAHVDLVGLQEVALWRSGPLRLPPPLGTASSAAPAATTVDIDFLALLLERLRSLGTPYEAVAVQQESDVEGPASPGAAALSSGRDVRLTMRDVVLRRVDSPVRVTRVQTGSYRTTVPLAAGPVTYAFVRGWAAVDATVGGRAFRFVDTHLESEHVAPAVAQTRELLAGPLETDTPVLLACDCNTDPANLTHRTLPDGTPDAAKDQPYRLLTGDGRLTDTWTALHPAAEGYTDGLSETLDDSPDRAAREFDHRIDFVLARGIRSVTSATVVGRDPAERTASGLWPSDHAGVVVTVML